MNKNKISTYIYNTIVILCIICGAVYAVSQFMHFGGGEVTDNARVCQNIVPQNCRVQGFIREVRFTEFQEVKKGDTLVIIEDAEFRLRLAQAEADLTRVIHGSQGTASSINTTKTSIGVTEAGIEAARVQMENAQREDARYEKLLQQDAVTHLVDIELRIALKGHRLTGEFNLSQREFLDALALLRTRHLIAGGHGSIVGLHLHRLRRVDGQMYHLIGNAQAVELGSLGTLIAEREGAIGRQFDRIEHHGSRQTHILKIQQRVGSTTDLTLYMETLTTTGGKP